jgi:hypothetical protein
VVQDLIYSCQILLANPHPPKNPKKKQIPQFYGSKWMYMYYIYMYNIYIYMQIPYQTHGDSGGCLRAERGMGVDTSQTDPQ